MAVASADGRPEVREDRAKTPKLPSFVYGKDDLDAYLQRFERFAATAKWEKTGWASEQFIVRLDRYLLRWLELSYTERSFEGLKDVIVEEHFIDSCPKELAIHLRERASETLDQIAKIADQYLEAHGKHLFSSATKKPLAQPKAEKQRTHRVTQQLSTVTSVMTADTKQLTAQL